MGYTQWDSPSYHLVGIANLNCTLKKFQSHKKRGCNPGLVNVANVSEGLNDFQRLQPEYSIMGDGMS